MNHKYHVFVTEYLKWGDQVLAYKNAYKSKGTQKSLQSAANRLLNHPEVAKAIDEAEARIRGEVEIAIANRQIKEVLTIEEKRSLLKQIATGSIYIEQKYKGKNCTQCSQYITSTIKEMLWAIREDSRLAGHYPYKLNGKWVIPAFREEEEIKPENAIDNISPRPNGSSGRALGAGGKLGQDENANAENDNKLQQPGEVSIDNQSPAINISPRPNGSSGRASGGGGKLVQNENTNAENDNKLQQTGKDNIDNQPITEDPEYTSEISLTGACPEEFREGIGGVNPSGKIISRAQLKELLHPNHKPQLMPMINEQHE